MTRFKCEGKDDSGESNGIGGGGAGEGYSAGEQECRFFHAVVRNHFVGVWRSWFMDRSQFVSIFEILQQRQDHLGPLGVRPMLGLAVLTQRLLCEALGIAGGALGTMGVPIPQNEMLAILALVEWCQWHPEHEL